MCAAVTRVLDKMAAGGVERCKKRLVAKNLKKRSFVCEHAASEHNVENDATSTLHDLHPTHTLLRRLQV